MSTHAPVSGKTVLDAEALGRTLSRIAHEIIEGNPAVEDVALVGIQTRGVPLAQRLARLIEERAGAAPALGAVDITFHRDDVMVRAGEAPLAPQPLVRATSLDFPLDHPFWGPFTQSQNRDISAGLSSLGFRFDGFGGWVDDRVPSQRDLSLAVGYAGLDPMRVRRWPTEPETRDLLRDVRVAADEYVIGAAGGLSLGELVTTPGRRADGLTDLWNQWGLARPVLLEAG